MLLMAPRKPPPPLETGFVCAEEVTLLAHVDPGTPGVAVGVATGGAEVEVGVAEGVGVTLVAHVGLAKTRSL